MKQTPRACFRRHYRGTTTLASAAKRAGVAEATARRWVAEDEAAAAVALARQQIMNDQLHQWDPQHPASGGLGRGRRDLTKIRKDRSSGPN